ncbi:Mitotic apparatus protein [Histomonas meleagridis]|uniref:Mitotic apparatus protein n=1 Tax=Histomonas meleagridis TaxID=135588 RepID=UPI00355AC854|nr:Mitotic apparatus protein [Histomonas meleagridis]KAH0799321.1 Mitotic apparatus protein [Histomonas meleagridis]
MDDIPNFERIDNPVFHVDEYVYVISTNEYDIYEAVVTSVDGDNYHVHYPDYPDDDETVEGTERILKETEQNKKIFNKQERIRLAKEKRMESDSDEDFIEDDMPKKKKKKREPKPKPEKKKREPRPKKEHKPREPKPKKEGKRRTKEHHTDPLKIKLNDVLRRAQSQRLPVDEFDAFLKREYRDDEEVYRRRDELQEKYEAIHAKTVSGGTPAIQQNLYDEENSSDDYYDYYDEQPEEVVQVFDPETIVLPERRCKSIDPCTELKLNSLKFQKKDENYSILFDDDGNSNCFIYRTDTGIEYLILNGYKFEIRNMNQDTSDLLYYGLPVSGNKIVTSHVYYPEKIITSSRLIPRPPDLSKNDMIGQKSGPKQWEELPDEPKQQNKSRSRSKGNSREFLADVEYSSDD